MFVRFEVSVGLGVEFMWGRPEVNPHLQLINSRPPWKALRAGVKQGSTTKLLLKGPKIGVLWDELY